MTRLDEGSYGVKTAEKVVATVEWSSASYRRPNIVGGRGEG